MIWSGQWPNYFTKCFSNLSGTSIPAISKLHIKLHKVSRFVQETDEEIEVYKQNAEDERMTGGEFREKASVLAGKRD